MSSGEHLRFSVKEEAEEDCKPSEFQAARAYLRERFLRAMTGLAGKKCKLHMLQDTEVSAEFKGCDKDVTRLLVSNLETPCGKQPYALIRTADTLVMQIPDIGEVCF